MDAEEHKLASCLAILGTGSDVGKSVVVTALCRIFSNRGRCVAPFKAQNMSNNSFVTPEGGEMGRAQVAQAEAARTQPRTDMNPVLLKPCADSGAQFVVHGKPWSEGRSVGDQPDGGILSAESRRALDRLRQAYDLIVMEGAGSCAEINLRDRDFANFRMAEAADAPVILVADIDRGGVFGQIIGTLAILQPEERLRIKGVIINRFRGDAKLFRDGTAFIEDQIQRPVLGLIPFFYHIDIDSEDGMTLEGLIDPAEGPALDKINIAVIRLPHISNFTDFAPLQREPAVQLHYLTRPRSLGGYDLVLLTGVQECARRHGVAPRKGLGSSRTEFRRGRRPNRRHLRWIPALGAHHLRSARRRGAARKHRRTQPATREHEAEQQCLFGKPV